MLANIAVGKFKRSSKNKRERMVKKKKMRVLKNSPRQDKRSQCKILIKRFSPRVQVEKVEEQVVEEDDGTLKQET